jgi:hypothetical protein
VRRHYACRTKPADSFLSHRLPQPDGDPRIWRSRTIVGIDFEQATKIRRMLSSCLRRPPVLRPVNIIRIFGICYSGFRINGQQT